MTVTATQLAHLARFLKQNFFLPEVAVIGGYHGGNLGDMALGLAVCKVLREYKITSGLQTIYNLEKWPKVPFAIVGGGAVGYIDSLLNLYERYKGDFSRLGFLGVDFNEVNYPENILRMLREAAFVSCRSANQAERLKKISKRENIFHHPDIAFSLLPEFCSNVRSSKLTKQKKVFVNVVPLYSNFKGGMVTPHLKFKEERPELYENFNLMHRNYKIAVRNSVKQALQEGYEVESAPFTHSDREYSRMILEGLPVKFPAYHSNPIEMLKYLSTGEKMISTRFHTTIFGLKTGANIQPIAYAKKNEAMLSELGLHSDEYISTSDLAGGRRQLAEGIEVDSEIICKWENESTTMIENCIKSILGNKNT